MAAEAYHANRDLDLWKDGRLWVPIFDAQHYLVCGVIVATMEDTGGRHEDRTNAEDQLLGEQRLAKILSALNS